MQEGFGEGVLSIWQAPLYQAGETTIHLSQLVIALLVIVLGFLLVRYVGGTLSRRIDKDSRVSAQRAHVIRKMVAYVGYLTIVLMALPIAGIPITVFAILGGALAIGVGFGAQNLLNNLISGIILLVEHPIRIGDVVELETDRGRVEDIGNRCVRIRRFDGVHVLVPNSYFLEQRVTNWTLVSNEVRGGVTVGVAYGSPTRRVEQLMLQAAMEQRAIDDSLANPEVLFEDFGDNSLVFTVFFWTRVQVATDLRRLQSTIRFRIDELFAEDGIVIAFPQRDVHLDISDPLPLRILDE